MSVTCMVKGCDEYGKINFVLIGAYKEVVFCDDHADEAKLLINYYNTTIIAENNKVFKKLRKLGEK